jgi:hypothetical protein
VRSAREGLDMCQGSLLSRCIKQVADVLQAGNPPYSRRTQAGVADKIGLSLGRFIHSLASDLLNSMCSAR